MKQLMGVIWFGIGFYILAVGVGWSGESERLKIADALTETADLIRMSVHTHSHKPPRGAVKKG
jgi:hypothetical protein